MTAAPDPYQLFVPSADVAEPVASRPKKKKKKAVPKLHPLVGAQKKEKKKRTCIKCSKEFVSRCAANRICTQCKRILGEQAVLPLTFHTELREADFE